MQIAGFFDPDVMEKKWCGHATLKSGFSRGWWIKPPKAEGFAERLYGLTVKPPPSPE
jgi:hypothetical protein